MPNSSRGGTEHFWVMGFKVCLNEEPCPFPRRDDGKIKKKGYKHLIEVLRYGKPGLND